MRSNFHTKVSCIAYILAFSIHSQPKPVYTHTHTHVSNCMHTRHIGYTWRHDLFLMLCAMSVFTIHATGSINYVLTISFETLQRSLRTHPANRWKCNGFCGLRGSNITIYYNTFYDLRVAVLDLPQWLREISSCSADEWSSNHSVMPWEISMWNLDFANK